MALDRLSRGKLSVQATAPCNRAPENPWCFFQASQDHHVRRPAPVRCGSPMGPLTLVNTSPGLVCATALSLPPGLGVGKHFDVTHWVATRSQSRKEMPGGTHPAPQPAWRDQSMPAKGPPSKVPSFYFLGEFRIDAVRRGAGEIKSLGIKVMILHRIWVALQNSESISRTCEHLSSYGRKERQTERSLFINEETGALRNSIVGPKSPITGLWLQCVHSTTFPFIEASQNPFNSSVKWFRTKLVMAIGCFTKSSKISLYTRTDKKLYLFFKLNNLNFLSDLAAAAATNKYMKLSTISHISWPFWCLLLWSACQVIGQFSTGFPCFFYV